MGADLPPGLGDVLLDFVVRKRAFASFGWSEGQQHGDWMVAIEWGREAPDSPMVGAAAYGADPSLTTAIEQALSDAHVNPCGTCGWQRSCPDGECHS